MALPEYYDIQAYEYSKGGINPVNISLSTEYTFTLRINGSPYTEVASSGSDMEEFAIGHLLSNGIIRSKDDVTDIAIDENKKEINIITDLNEKMLERLLSIKFIASGCGQGGKTENLDAVNTSLPMLNARMIIDCMHAFLRYSDNHLLTHGAHSSALYSTRGEMIAYFEDIGRHNAVDKTLGFAIKNQTDLHDVMIVSTGRLSSEIVYKSINAGVPAVITRSSTTTMGYELAVKHNVILIGRIRSGSFIIYNGRDCISC